MCNVGIADWLVWNIITCCFVFFLQLWFLYNIKQPIFAPNRNAIYHFDLIILSTYLFLLSNYIYLFHSMKKNLKFGAISLVCVLAGFTSCQDEDFGLTESVIKEKTYEQSFIKEFGQPSANQRWDFYAQEMEAREAAKGVTRATAAVSVNVTPLTAQPAFIAQSGIAATCNQENLPEYEDNSAKGTRDYTLTYNGPFTVSAILYGGSYEKPNPGLLNPDRNPFEFGIAVPDPDVPWIIALIRRIFGLGEAYLHTKIFGSKDFDGETVNPGYAANISMTDVSNFDFYIRVRDGFLGARTYYYSSDSRSTLLAEDSYTSEIVNSDGSITRTTTYYRMIGFEDKWSDPDLDMNDVVVVLSSEEQTNLPAPITARYICEDMEKFDWDFNDVVFDVTNTGITLYAVGGTLPVKLKYKVSKYNQSGNVVSTDEFTSPELHEVMGGEKLSEDPTLYKPINVAADNGITRSAVKINFENYYFLTNEEIAAFAPTLIVEGGEVGTVESPFDATARVPAIIQVPASFRWMKEMKKITIGYPTFYAGEQWYYNIGDASSLY